MLAIYIYLLKRITQCEFENIKKIEQVISFFPWFSFELSLDIWICDIINCFWRLCSLFHRFKLGIWLYAKFIFVTWTCISFIWSSLNSRSLQLIWSCLWTTCSSIQLILLLRLLKKLISWIHIVICLNFILF